MWDTEFPDLQRHQTKIGQNKSHFESVLLTHIKEYSAASTAEATVQSLHNIHFKSMSPQNTLPEEVK